MPLLETKGAASAQGFGLTSGGAAPVYVDDVFSTWLYNGTGATQTITNGIDLAGKGGMLWIKGRSAASNNFVVDTARGSNKYIFTNGSSAEATSPAGSDVTSFNSDGFSFGTYNSNINFSGTIYTSWTFRKQPKFFDVVTYTGTGANRTVAHSLGSVPGCIFIKRTDLTADWAVYHTSIGAANGLRLNDTAASFAASDYFNSTSPTSSVFTVGSNARTNASGGTYVAYLFAHDAGGFGASGSDNVISCGGYTGNGSTNGPEINLGFEPQWLLVKEAAGTSAAFAGWYVFDNLRGFTASGSNDVSLRANESAAEDPGADYFAVQSTGFKCTTTNALANESGGTYIYVAIRRPNKPPTTGTQVFTPTVYTGTNVDNRLVNTTTLADMVWVRQRNSTTVSGMVVGDRLRGQPYLLTGSTDQEVNDADSFDAQLVSAVEYGTAFSSMNGFWCGNDATSQLNASTTANNQIAEAFKRAPGFFDVVCYTGTGANRTVSHNLGAVPELMIIKRRQASSSYWPVYSAALGSSNFLALNTSDASLSGGTVVFTTTPTASVFSLGTYADVNASGGTFVAHLFASIPGISKVGSYTGNGGAVNTIGTSQTINCGFSAGARFILIKRTDSSLNSSDWYVFDSARGIVAGNDPYIKLNTTNAEASVDDVVVDNSGFIVSQMNGTNLNVTGATYIFLSVA
jgi:hypothetical protein